MAELHVSLGLYSSYQADDKWEIASSVANFILSHFIVKGREIHKICEDLTHFSSSLQSYSTAELLIYFCFIL